MNKQELLSRLETRKIITPNGCWLFSGPNTLNKREIYIEDRNYLVARVSAYIFKDLNIYNTNQLVCHHSHCTEPNCWNPDHYYIGDSQSNVGDAVADGVHKNGNSNKEICKNGHDLSGANLYIYMDLKGYTHRWCRICRKKASRRHNRRRGI